MESWFSSKLITAAALLLPVILFVMKKRNANNSARILPPGPRKLPIIGDLHRLRKNPLRTFRDLSEKYGPMIHLKLGQVSTIVISSPEIAKEVLKEQDPNFAGRPGNVAFEILSYNQLGVGFCQYGDYWKDMRKIIVMEMLSAKCVRSFGSIRDDEISRLLKSIRASCELGKPINLTEKSSTMTSSIICRAAFGKVCKDVDVFVKLTKEGLQKASGLEIADMFPSWKITKTLSLTRLRLRRLRRKIDVILDNIIKEHKENFAKMAENGDSTRIVNGEFGNEDLVDVFLRVKETQELQLPINNEHIKANLFEIFVGGTDSGASLMNWTMVELLKNQRVLAKVQSEVREVCKGSKTITNDDVHKLKYLKLVIMESMRLHPPSPMVSRASRVECQINGYTIPNKANVFINLWQMHRDPKYWTNAESFEPERFENGSMNYSGADFQFLPFGSGRRICPGITFAMAGVDLFLANILYNFDWKLPDGTKLEESGMAESLTSTSRRKADLLVVATPYESLA